MIADQSVYISEGALLLVLIVLVIVVLLRRL